MKSPLSEGRREGIGFTAPPRVCIGANLPVRLDEYQGTGQQFPAEPGG